MGGILKAIYIYDSTCPSSPSTSGVFPHKGFITILFAVPICQNELNILCEKINFFGIN